jgi:hypothetical protein
MCMNKFLYLTYIYMIVFAYVHPTNLPLGVDSCKCLSINAIFVEEFLEVSV